MPKLGVVEELDFGACAVHVLETFRFLPSSCQKLKTSIKFQKGLCQVESGSTQLKTFLCQCRLLVHICQCCQHFLSSSLFSHCPPTGRSPTVTDPHLSLDGEMERSLLELQQGAVHISRALGKHPDFYLKN